MGYLSSDVRYALRRLTANRGFTLTAVLTLAVGIGVTTAIYSVLDALLFRPLPYRDPAGLLQLNAVQPGGRPTLHVPRSASLNGARSSRSLPRLKRTGPAA